ncbi:MAG TPA: hypothetical protein VJC17_04510 [Candidatus Dojkabacteria bacterium]|nr:hypothetical protein [Candidatus Dojkabacteria bacterium]
MKKKILTIAAVGILGLAAVMLPITALAQTVPEPGEFIARLAAKLGIEQTKVETAFSEVKNEFHAERMSELKSQLQKYVDEDKLTQREADLLYAAADLRFEIKAEFQPFDKEALQNLTIEEHRAKMEEMHNNMVQQMIASLNENGLNTNTEELQAAQQKAHELGIMGVAGFGKKVLGFGMSHQVW